MYSVLYCSQGGTSKKYAEWLSADLGCRCLPVQEADKLEKYSDIIYVGWRNGPFKVEGFDEIRNMFNVVAVLLVGLEQMDDETLEEIKDKTEIGPLFYVRGGMDRSKLKLGQKIILGLVSIKMRFTSKTEEDKRTREIMNKGGNMTSRDQLDEIEQWLEYGSIGM